MEKVVRDKRVPKILTDDDIVHEPAHAVTGVMVIEPANL